MPARLVRFAVFAALVAPLPALAQLNLYCSSPNTAWCQGMAVGFEKATGTKVAVVQKATGEMLAQIKAEGANPKGDVWWAGPADSYLQAAENGLLETYRSPNVAQLYPWAQRISEISNYRVAGVYGGILALGYNTEIGAKKMLPVPRCWKDLLNPALKGEVMLGNPNSSGTAYLMLASLVQIMGEEEAFKFMVDLNRNVTSYARSGIGPMTAVTRGARCQSLASPSSAEYWHMGDTTVRLRSVRPRNVKGEKSCEGGRWAVTAGAMLAGSGIFARRAWLPAMTRTPAPPVRARLRPPPEASPPVARAPWPPRSSSAATW